MLTINGHMIYSADTTKEWLRTLDIEPYQYEELADYIWNVDKPTNMIGQRAKGVREEIEELTRTIDDMETVIDERDGEILSLENDILKHEEENAKLNEELRKLKEVSK